MLRNKWYMIGLFICFIGGVYTWKIANTGRHAHRDFDDDAMGQFPTKATLVYVGREPISSEDLEWEYNLHTAGISASDDLTPIPDYGEKAHNYLGGPLRERLLSGMIERKLLYQFIKQDNEFDLTNPTRYVNCLKEWQANVAEGKNFLTTPKDKERLKSRLCEQSILIQYLEERVYPKADVTEKEMLDYFNDHKNEFRTPPRVLIRQIVLPTEGEARKALGNVNRANFADFAKELSIAPEAEKGGLVGPFDKEQLPNIFEVAFSMRVGQISNVIKSTYGFHIVKLEKKIPRTTLGYREAQPKIRDILLKKKREEEYQKWVEIALNAVQVNTPKPLW